MNRDILLSCVLCTVGRREEAARFLESLRLSGLSDMELIVVDQNHDDRVKSLLEAAGLFETGRCRRIVQAVPHLAAARNRGIAASRGRYLFFADDDSTLPEAFPETVRSLTERYRDADVIAGMTRDPADDSVSVCRFRETGGHRIDLRNIWYSLTAGATLFRSEAVRAAGLFDEDFGYNARYPSAEDLELGLRLVRGGARLYFDPGLVVYHPGADAVWGRGQRERFRRHGIGLGAAVRKHLGRDSFAPLLGFFCGRLLRPFAGMMLGLLSLRMDRFLGYLAFLTGRLKGFVAYRRS